MKTKYLFIMIVSLFTFSKVFGAYELSDTTYVYSYDASGNRTERIIDLSKSATIQNGSITDNEHRFEEELNNFNIKIYPNPTKGNLKVDITGLTATDSGQLLLYNSEGRLIINQSISNSTSDLSLTNCPAGHYILKIILGQYSSEWKILKD